MIQDRISDRTARAIGDLVERARRAEIEERTAEDREHLSGGIVSSPSPLTTAPTGAPSNSLSSAARLHPSTARELRGSVAAAAG